LLAAFLKDSIVYLIPTVISRGLALILLPLYTRVLSPADYGSLDLLVVFAGIVKLTVALEVTQGVARYFGSEQDPVNKIAYASSALWFSVFAYSVFAAIALLFSDQLAPIVMGREGLKRAYQLGIVFIWISGIFYVVQNQFRWGLRSRRYAELSLIMAVVTGVVSISLTYGLELGLEGLIIGMIVGAAVPTCVALAAYENNFRLVIDRRRLSEMLRFSFPLVFSSIAVWVNWYADRLMINYFLSVDDVGLYGVAYRVASIVGFAMLGFQSALTPLIYVHYQSPDTPDKLARIFRIFVFIALSGVLVLTVWVDRLLLFLTTTEYFSAALLIVILIPGILLSNMHIFMPGAGIEKKTHLIVIVNVAGGLLNIGLNVLLIPAYGLTGAAISTSGSFLVAFLVHVSVSQRLYYIPVEWKPIVRAAVLVGVLGAISMIVHSDGWMYAAVNVGLVLTGVLLLSNVLLKREDLEGARKILLFMARRKLCREG
jgi:O-antigen/teichoic acid export membrane protein